MATVYLGLGGNRGDRQAHLAAALTALAGVGRVEAVSSLYETAPLYEVAQPPFLNAACRVGTDLAPAELLAALKGIERAVGRRPSYRNGPREIDLDILLYDDLVVAGEGLAIPHPRLAERAFALAPLAELAPVLVHPVLGLTVAALLRRVEGREGVRRHTPAGPWPPVAMQPPAGGER